MRRQQMKDTSGRTDLVMAAQRFLVPIDFSESANQALDYAITLAGNLGARLTLRHVMQSLPLGGVDMDVTLPVAYVEDLEAEIRRSLASCLERVTAARLEGDSEEEWSCIRR